MEKDAHTPGRRLPQPRVHQPYHIHWSEDHLLRPNLGGATTRLPRLPTYTRYTTFTNAVHAYLRPPYVDVSVSLLIEFFFHQLRPPPAAAPRSLAAHATAAL